MLYCSNFIRISYHLKCMPKIFKLIHNLWCIKMKARQEYAIFPRFLCLYRYNFLVYRIVILDHESWFVIHHCIITYVFSHPSSTSDKLLRVISRNSSVWFLQRIVNVFACNYFIKFSSKFVSFSYVLIIGIFTFFRNKGS